MATIEGSVCNKFEIFKSILNSTISAHKNCFATREVYISVSVGLGCSLFVCMATDILLHSMFSVSMTTGYQ